MQDKSGFTAKLKSNIQGYGSLLGLIAVVLFFALATKGQSVTIFNLKILVNQMVILATIATCSTFIFTMGSFDISLGAVTCLASVLGALVANATGSIVMMFFTCLGTAIVVSLLNGACIALFKLPSFIVTLATMNIMAAGVTLILGSSSMVTVNNDLKFLDTTLVKVSVLIFVIILSVVMFNFNKLGRGNKIIGGNQTVAVQSGISLIKNTLATFLLSGIGIGFGSFLLLARTGSVSAQTGSSLGFDIIISIVLGGMPISGGARSKITAAIIGAFTITALNNGLVIVGVSTGILQAIRGALFLTVVALMMFKHREKLLPR